MTPEKTTLAKLVIKNIEEEKIKRIDDYIETLISVKEKSIWSKN